jgi:ABC-type uncharacterized transport system involved in gliding motility auxiliary subunit
MKNKELFSPAGLVLIGVALLIAVVIISTLPRLRIDLTEDDLYSLSDGTRQVLSNLDRPIELTFFYSEQSIGQMPQVRAYGNRVQELLREMVIASNGNLTLQIVDPEPFSEQEDLATSYGIQAVPLAAGREEVYFGVVAADPDTLAEEDNQVYETIPLVRPDQEEFLEYEFSRLISRVLDPNPTVVGLITSLNIDGGFNPATEQTTGPWAIMDTVRYMYDVRRLPEDVAAIDEDIDILMLVHPQELPETTLYAIDQFVLRGGRAVIFVDPNSDTQTQIMVGGGGYRDNLSSDLPGLLNAWGIDYDATQVVTDQALALFVTLAQGQRPTAHYGMLGVPRENFANDIVSGQLQVMNLSSAGSLNPAGGTQATFEPLIQTSEQTMLMGNDFFREMGDPTLLIDDFVSQEQTRTLAARVSGPAQSAFPDGPPQAEEEPSAGEEPSANEEPETAPQPHLQASVSDIGVIVVADTDVLADRMWAQSQQVAGQRVINAFASNGDFVINALDNLSGSTELINIRSRGRYARPFTRVLALQREADERLRERETNLLERLSETEEQLQALNQGSGTISPEQEAEIERFIDLQLQTRQDLREVQFELNNEIDRLGAILKAINTALIPVLIIIGVLAAALLRNRRRKLVRRPLT